MPCDGHVDREEVEDSDEEDDELAALRRRKRSRMRIMQPLAKSDDEGDNRVCTGAFA